MNTNDIISGDIFAPATAFAQCHASTVAALPGDLPFPEGLRHVLVEPGTTDAYRFLHDAAIVAHNGVLFAGWYNCPEREIEGESLIRARVDARPLVRSVPCLLSSDCPQ